MRLLDKAFKYTPAAATDIRKLFAKVRKELEAQKKDKPNIVPIKKARKS